VSSKKSPEISEVVQADFVEFAASGESRGFLHCHDEE
jgi:hypothetical protein